MAWLLAASGALAGGSPASKAAREARSATAFPVRDTVIGNPSPTAARVSATASARRYPVGDDRSRSVEIAVTASCRLYCSDADPAEIASFLGTLPHASEMNLLKVELDAPWQIASTCGAGAQACYYPFGDRMVINGNATLAKDNATREFVIAHEYGHHLADHRPAPPPNSPAIAWGTPRWARYERVCRTPHPGGYFRNPGEAFAESFAFLRFPDAPVRWAWSASLKPDAGAFAAIRADVRSPWRERSLRLGSARLRRGGRTAYAFSTPFDGAVTLRLRGSSASRFVLRLVAPSGRVLRSSVRRRLGASLRFNVCGQRRLRVVVRKRGPGADRYRLAIERP